MIFLDYVHGLIFFVGYCSIERNYAVEGLEKTSYESAWIAWMDFLYVSANKKEAITRGHPPVK